MKIQNDWTELNEVALADPQPGDFWAERIYCPYFVVVNVKDGAITVLPTIGENNARIDNKDGTWSFDYSKSRVVDRLWMENQVKYKSIEGFVADVSRTDRWLEIVDEWTEYRVRAILKELDDLGPTASKYLLTKDKHEA